MNSVFLCYRSTYDAFAATLFDEKLSGMIGRKNVFRASRSVAPGESYADAIMAALEACRTVLVIIGPTWREQLVKLGQDDWVRTEIATALQRKKKIVPVLLGSRTPRLAVEDLPEDISDLAFLQYLRFDHRHVETGMAKIFAALDHTTRQSHREQSEFTMRCDPGWDGRLEVDVVQRKDGAITGRLSGHAYPHDLVRMAEFIINADNRPT